MFVSLFQIQCLVLKDFFIKTLTFCFSLELLALSYLPRSKLIQHQICKTL